MEKPARAHLVPDYRFRSVDQIDQAQLRARGVRGLILDLDDTLCGKRSSEVPPALRAWLVEAALHFRLFIVSNNRRHERVRVVAEDLGIPFIARAVKPRRASLRQAAEAMRLGVSQVAVIGDRPMTDVLGGNRLGMVTILVDPLSPDHPWLSWWRSLERGFSQ